MSDEQLDLLFLGGSHVEDASDRFDLINQNFETVDTVFIESVIGDESPCIKFVNGFRAPLIVPGVLLALKTMGFLSNLTGKGDGKLKQQIIDEYAAEEVVIDESFHPSIDASPYLWPISNYTFIFGIYILSTEFSSLIFTLIVLVYVNLAIFIFYLAATLHGRDSKMALDIEQYAQTHSGNACVIVGGFHEKGMIDRLSKSSIVQIVSQDN